MNRPTRNTLFGMALCLVLAVLWSCKAKAYFDNGNGLYAVCQSRLPFEVGECLGEVVGQYDMMMTLGYRCGNDSTKSKQQLKDVVLKYLQDNPALRSETAASLSFLAYMTAFNCSFPEPVPNKK